MNKLSDTLPAKESLTIEFKSDHRGFPDQDLIVALTCLANTEGGELWLGVEDDGVPSGLHASHKDLAKLTALIAEGTSPSLHVSVSKHCFAGVDVAKINVPKSARVITTAGVHVRRRLKSDDTPECVSVGDNGEFPDAVE